MPPVDPYIVGRTGSFCVPTLGCVDAELARLAQRLAAIPAVQAAASDVEVAAERERARRRAPLLADCDALLERRLALTGRKVHP